MKRLKKSNCEKTKSHHPTARQGGNPGKGLKSLEKLWNYPEQGRGVVWERAPEGKKKQPLTRGAKGENKAKRRRERIAPECLELEFHCFNKKKNKTDRGGVRGEVNRLGSRR